MRKLLLLIPALLAACATTSEQPPVHGLTSAHTCKTTGTEHFVGQAATSDTGAAIMKETNSGILRWAPPGFALTMDFRIDRVTVRLGPDNKVIGIDCG